MDYFNVSPSECLIFEDTIQGIKAGHSANIEVVGVGDINTLDGENIKNQVDYFVEFLEDCYILKKTM